MLPAEHRLRRTQEFRRTVRRGVRGGRSLVVVHLAPGPDRAAPTTVGFVVSRAVGGAVTRNRVRRRLRHLVRERLEQVPAGRYLVVRAQPGAAVASSAELAVDLDAALERVITRSASSR